MISICSKSHFVCTISLLYNIHMNIHMNINVDMNIDDNAIKAERER